MPQDSRARLIAYLCQAGLSTARANAVLDDYTHGLAEKIRALDPIDAALAGQHAWNDAADLIDPKVKAKA
ncbi:hypothetical protein PV405_08670 [Streptomyces sp. ME02-6979-3A]|uniref:hypothetical protein n=1 Tax=Streptomyces sp. ME02-6979-3A TaxID=3028673 RepID=UPI0029A068D3|nr:hypothetical protein [Streptomyces sp. ME02-6979-3A]MDX3324739.1 hypothetical protein [Streptomyces sp. ME02-6979-3A]